MNSLTSARVKEDHVDLLSKLGQQDSANVQKMLLEARQEQDEFLRNREKSEVKVDAKLGKLLGDPTGAQTVADLLDRAMRIDDDRLALNEFIRILKAQGIPTMFSAVERMALTLLIEASNLLPAKFVMAQIRAKIIRDTDGKVLVGDSRELIPTINALLAEGFKLNSVVLSEMVLGKAGVDKKVKDILELMERKSTTCISVKISNLDPHINALDFEGSVQRVCENLRIIMKKAKEKNILVNLDMEEYRDLGITVEVMKRIAMEPEFINMKMGIALQAYIPDSAVVQKDLVEFAKARVKKGGSPIRTRIVKGANMAMEDVHAAKNGFEDPVFQSKVETDANWKKMVEFGLREANLAVCNLGIASHNMLELQWVKNILEGETVDREKVDIEMLNGMVQSHARRVQEVLDNVLLYASEVLRAADFSDSAPYLGRRVSEQADQGNFIPHRLAEPGSDEWKKVEEAFIRSLLWIARVSDQPRHAQNRLTDKYGPVIFEDLAEFVNSPNTNFALPANREWVEQQIVQPVATENVNMEVPAKVGRKEYTASQVAVVESKTESRFKVGKVNLVGAENFDSIIQDMDTENEGDWKNIDMNERAQILANVAVAFERNRGEFMKWMLVETGKTAAQSDVEVSEAIDFVNLCSASYRYFASLKGVSAKPLKQGRVLVAGPWNFPLAIPVNGIFSSLMSGNKVALKPAPESRLVAAAFVKACYEEGVPESMLYLVNCSDEDAPELSKRFDNVILTGASQTAEAIIKANPRINLMAETGGKNATIVTHRADYDLAIKDILASFHHAGQKCSATSRIIITREVADDPTFLQKLQDAVESLKTGYPVDPATIVTTLINPPNTTTKIGLTELKDEETWLVKPKEIAPDLWTPGIVSGTKPRSISEQTEFFAPVMHVLVADNLDHAIEIANDTEYGLTFGIETLDIDEARYVVDRVQAGVCYVNLPTVGAVVKRMGFGGWKQSRFGMGVQAGWENYQLNATAFENDPLNLEIDFNTEISDPEYKKLFDNIRTTTMKNGVILSVASYIEWFEKYFSKPSYPPVQIPGEDYVHEFHPLGTVEIRVDSEDDIDNVYLACMAAKIAGNKINLSVAPSIDLNKLNQIGPINTETEDEFSQRMKKSKPDLVRFCGGELPSYIEEVRKVNPSINVNCRRVVCHGRIELHNYLQEKTIAAAMHRGGAPTGQGTKFRK